MTLILTQLSKYGIIHASDSNLTSNNANAGEGRKVFPIPFLNAGLCLAGAYSVRQQLMDVWMDNFIADQATEPNITLAQFSHNLKMELETQMLPGELDSGSLIQVAGYVEKEGLHHPEFWFVRNIHEIDLTTGQYMDFRHDFAVSEDFWTRDCRNNNSHISFEQGGYQLYINGFASGRMSYIILQHALNEFFQLVWHNRNWAFRPPNSLDEAQNFVRLYMQCVTTLFLSSNYRAHYIGGDAQVETIAAPVHTTLGC